MCIYCGTNKYRKIYESHFGPIPKDEDGHSYEIHHIDGNRNNNSLENLQCVSIQEHYDIHYGQGDWAACSKLAARMKMPPKIISMLSTLSNNERVKNKTHNFLGDNNPSHRRVEEGTHNLQGNGSLQRNVQEERVRNGTHHFLGGTLQKRLARKRIEDGSHHFLSGDRQRELAMQQLQENRHNFTKPWKCEYCHKSGKGIGMYNKWHGKNCKKAIIKREESEN